MKTVYEIAKRAKKIRNIEKRLADLENTVQSQQERLKKLKLDRMAIYRSMKAQLSTIRDMHEEEKS